MTALRVSLAAATAAVLLAGTPGVADSNQDTPPSAQTCLAIVLPSVQGVEGSAADVASAVRDLFVSYLSGPSIRTISLEARLPSQAVLEARQKDCGQVLIPSMVRKRPSSKLSGFLGQAVGTAAWHMPYGTGVGAAVAAGAAAGAAQAISSFASETAKKDEIELVYRLGTPASVEQSKPVIAKAKAKVDREDLLTPLVERAAQDIVAVATTTH